MTSPQDAWVTLRKWFPDLEEEKWTSLQEFCTHLREWNTKINLVSRKDMDRLETKHLAHCLTITKFLRLMPKARLLDVGTGGGLPGIALAICYPQARFTLIDSIGKKVMVVEDMVKKLGLKNVEIRRGRAEDLPRKRSYDFGILYLKGGDYTEELKTSGLHPAKIWNLDELLPEAGLGEKYLIHFKI